MGAMPFRSDAIPYEGPDQTTILACCLPEAAALPSDVALHFEPRCFGRIKICIPMRSDTMNY